MKKRLFQYIVGIAISLIVAVFVIIFFINEHGYSFAEHWPKILSDAAFINVTMYIGMWLLTLISQQGAFDIFAYSFKKLRASLFKKNEKYQDVPKTFYDYRILKQEEEKNYVHYLGFIGLGWTVLMIVFTVIFALKNNETDNISFLINLLSLK